MFFKKNMSLLKNSIFIWGNGFRRHFSLSKMMDSAYDGEGKTTVTVLNKSADHGVMIDSYSKLGFRLNNGMFVYGPMALFPKTALSWNVKNDQDIHEKSLKLFQMLEPKIDLLVIGYGGSVPPSNSMRLHEFRVKQKINLEILPVDKAVATFNYLCGEGRWVAGAFMPPEKVQLYEQELADQLAKKKESYMLKDSMF